MWERIGEERTFEVGVIAPQLLRREIIRPKYRHVLDGSRTPIVADAPQGAVMGGYASAGLLVSKYVDHQPLFCLEKQSERWVVRIPARSMADWVRMTSEWLEPIYKRMTERLIAVNYLQVDESPSDVMILTKRRVARVRVVCG